MDTTDQFQVRDRRKHPHIWYHKAIIEKYGKQLGVYGHSVYAALTLHADNTAQDCYPSYSKIADYYGISRRQVIREIEKLVELKLVKVDIQVVPNSKGHGKETNRFTLLDLPDEDNTSDYQSDLDEKTGDYQSPVTTSHPTSDYQSPVPVTTSHPNYTHNNYTHGTNNNNRGAVAVVSTNPKEVEAVKACTSLISNNARGFISGATSDSIKHLIAEFSAEWVIKGVAAAAKANGTSLAYLEKILLHWQRHGEGCECRNPKAEKPAPIVEFNGYRRSQAATAEPSANDPYWQSEAWLQRQAELKATRPFRA